nr:MAG TPA: tail tube protein [Caudoviricetes sp.]
MANTPISIQNSILSYKTGASETFTEVEGIYSFPALGQKPEKVDVTPIHAEGFRRYRKAGVIDMGDLDFSVFYDKDVYKALKTLANDNTNVSWQIKYSDGLTDEFTATCAVVMNEAGDIDDTQSFTLSLYLTSKLTETFAQ